MNYIIGILIVLVVVAFTIFALGLCRASAQIQAEQDRLMQERGSQNSVEGK